MAWMVLVAWTAVSLLVEAQSPDVLGNGQRCRLNAQCGSACCLRHRDYLTGLCVPFIPELSGICTGFDAPAPIVPNPTAPLGQGQRFDQPLPAPAPGAKAPETPRQKLRKALIKLLLKSSQSSSTSASSSFSPSSTFDDDSFSSSRSTRYQVAQFGSGPGGMAVQGPMSSMPSFQSPQSPGPFSGSFAAPRLPLGPAGAALPPQLVTTASQGTVVTGAYVYSCNSCDTRCCCGTACCDASVCSTVGEQTSVAVSGQLCTGCASLCCCGNQCCASSFCGLNLPDYAQPQAALPPPQPQSFGPAPSLPSPGPTYYPGPYGPGGPGGPGGGQGGSPGFPGAGGYNFAGPDGPNYGGYGGPSSGSNFGPSGPSGPNFGPNYGRPPWDGPNGGNQDGGWGPNGRNQGGWNGPQGNYGPQGGGYNPSGSGWGGPQGGRGGGWGGGPPGWQQGGPTPQPMSPVARVTIPTNPTLAYGGLGFPPGFLDTLGGGRFGGFNRPGAYFAGVPNAVFAGSQGSQQQGGQSPPFQPAVFAGDQPGGASYPNGQAYQGGGGRFAIPGTGLPNPGPNQQLLVNSAPLPSSYPPANFYQSQLQPPGGPGGQGGPYRNGGPGPPPPPPPNFLGPGQFAQPISPANAAQMGGMGGDSDRRQYPQHFQASGAGGRQELMGRGRRRRRKKALMRLKRFAIRQFLALRKR